jgi:regulator of sigma E protease
MSGILGGLWHVVPFLVGVTLLVFVHEMGHYLVARWAGVRIETFSIGFGPEIFGWFDRHGTRWRMSAIPIGGYVMMYGDADATSRPGEPSAAMTEAERAVSHHYKPVAARAAITVAGPLANFLFTIVVFAALFMTIGQSVIPATVKAVKEGSVAEQVGIQPGDRFVSIDGHPIDSFQDLLEAVTFNTGDPMRMVLHRGDADVTIVAIPQLIEDPDGPDNKIAHRRLGIEPPAPVFVRHDPLTATWLATEQTWEQGGMMLRGIGQILTGTRSTRELGGMVSVGKALDDAAQGGIISFFLMMAVWSINLGLINLFPIPVLDGGHLLFYAAEAVLGRPLGRRTQEFGFKVGLALVLTLMVFANGNDLVHRVIPFLKHLFT